MNANADDTTVNSDNDETPIGIVITMSDTFRESLSEQQFAAYVDALDSVARDQFSDVPAITEELKQRMHAAGIDLAPVEAERLGEHLIGRSDASLTILTDDARVLFDRPAPSAAAPQPDVNTDPEHPDRPSLI